MPSKETLVEVYFSVDVETDGPIPGHYSMLSFGIVYAGRFDGMNFVRPSTFEPTFYRELRPISEDFQLEALAINGLDRDLLMSNGTPPRTAMAEAFRWVTDVADGIAEGATPVMVGFPLVFDWMWIYWYFIRFNDQGSPFGHSRGFDSKTAFAVKGKRMIAMSGRRDLLPELCSLKPHHHNALADAIEQAEIFANLFEWETTCDNSSLR